MGVCNLCCREKHPSIVKLCLQQTLFYFYTGKSRGNQWRISLPGFDVTLRHSVLHYCLLIMRTELKLQV